MHPDSVEVNLPTVEYAEDYTYKIHLKITAFLNGTDTFEKNTLEFRCQPIGENYDLTYLRVVLKDWSQVVEIRDFLAHHFSDDSMERHRKTIEIDEGIYTLRPRRSEGRSIDGLDEFTIDADTSDNRVEFGGMASMTPYFHTCEEKDSDGPPDSNNADKILGFFDEIIALHPTYDPDSEPSKVDTVFDPRNVEEQLASLTGSDSSMFEDYQKAVREFEKGEYKNSIRDLGSAGEGLIKRLCEHIYESDDIPSGHGRRLNKLDKTEDGVPSMIGKAISPMWWLRNRSSHPSADGITRDEIQYAHLCFQIAVEKYVEDFLDEED